MSKSSALRFCAWMAPSLLGAAALAGCSSEPETTRPIGTSTLFAELAPPPVSVTIQAEVGGLITGHGTSFRIPGGAIFLPGGMPGYPPDMDTDGDGVVDSYRVKGKVKVILRELLSAEDMALAGRPTVTSDGQLLETGGAFDLTCLCAEGTDKVLQVTQLRDLRIQPTKQPSSPAGMELWLADANAPGEFGWRRPTSGSVKAEQVGNSFVVPTVPSGRINRPVTSKNIDVPRTAPPQTLAPLAPVSVQFAAAEPDEAAVFFFPAGLSSVVRLERDDTGAYVAPASVMHADLTGRLVVVSVADGRYAYEEREVSLAHTRSFVVDPAEVTRDELRARLNAPLSAR